MVSNFRLLILKKKLFVYIKIKKYYFNIFLNKKYFKKHRNYNPKCIIIQSYQYLYFDYYREVTKTLLFIKLSGESELVF